MILYSLPMYMVHSILRGDKLLPITFLTHETLPPFESRQPHDRSTCYEAPRYDRKHLNLEKPICGNPRINAHHERNLEREYRQSSPIHRNRQKDNRENNKNTKVDVQEYGGRLDPNVFLDWLDNMEDYFTWYNMTNIERVCFAKNEIDWFYKKIWAKCST